MSEVRQLAVSLQVKATTTPAQTRAVASKAGLNMKNAWRDATASSRHFRQIGPTVSYDLRDSGSFIEVEVGPDTSIPSAKLENIYHFGTSRGGGTGGDPMRFLEAEVPAFINHLGKLGEVIP
jgi:hypothetical protein